MSNGRYPLLEATGRGLEHAYRMTETAFAKKQAFEYGKMMAREQAELQLEKQKEITELTFLISAFTASKTISGRQFYGEKLQGKTGWNVLQNLDESVKLLKDIEAKGKDDPQTAIKMLTSVPDLIGTVEAKSLLTRAGMGLLAKPGATEEEKMWGRFGLTEAGVKPEEVVGKREKPDIHVGKEFQDEEGKLWQTITIDGVPKTVAVEPEEARGPTTISPSGIKETPLGPPQGQLKGKIPKGSWQYKTEERETDLGKEFRRIFFDPETTQIIEGPWINKGKKSVVSREDIDKLYMQYNIARIKAKDDPLRMIMAAMLKDQGIAVDLNQTWPELSRGEFETYVTTGKLSPQKETPKEEKEKTKYKSAEEVKAAYQKGELTWEEASKVLVDRFGYVK